MYWYFGGLLKVIWSGTYHPLIIIREVLLITCLVAMDFLILPWALVEMD